MATDAGHFTVAALDHRDALRAEFEQIASEAGGGETGRGEAGGTKVGGDEAVRRFKRDLLAGLMAMAVRPSAVMLEPEYSLPDLAGEVSAGIGISCALEAQGYFSEPEAGNALMPGWHPARVRDVGAQVAKLLVLYRHDRGSFTRSQEALVAEVVTAAAEAGVPVLIEPVPVDVVDAADRRAVIVASAKRLRSLGPMLLKLPYPGPGACAELTEATGDRPWLLLSWGVPFEEFREQLVEACSHGASGFAVGRALWREAVDPARRDEFIRSRLAERFAELASIAATGRPWTDVG